MISTPISEIAVPATVGLPATLMMSDRPAAQPSVDRLTTGVTLSTFGPVAGYMPGVPAGIVGFTTLSPAPTHFALTVHCAAVGVVPGENQWSTACIPLVAVQSTGSFIWNVADC